MENLSIAVGFVLTITCVKITCDIFIIKNLGTSADNKVTTYNSWYKLGSSHFSHHHWVVEIHLLFRVQLLYSIMSTDKQSTSGTTISTVYVNRLFTETDDEKGC